MKHGKASRREALSEDRFECVVVDQPLSASSRHELERLAQREMDRYDDARYGRPLRVKVTKNGEPVSDLVMVKSRRRPRPLVCYSSR